MSESMKFYSTTRRVFEQPQANREALAKMNSFIKQKKITEIESKNLGLFTLRAGKFVFAVATLVYNK